MKDRDPVFIFFNKIFSKKKELILIILIFSFLGFVFAFLAKNSFTAETSFLPQSTDSKSAGVGGVSTLASLAGISLGENGNGTDLPPSLYPKIIESNKFGLKILDSKFYYPLIKDSISYRKYYNEYYKPGVLESVSDFLFSLPSSLFGSRSATNRESSNTDKVDNFIDEFDNELLTKLRESINVAIDSKDGLVRLSFTMDNPLGAYEMAKIVERELQNELINIKILNSQNQLAYASLLKDEKLEEFINSQKELAKFKDSNITLSTSSAQNYLSLLESDFAVKQKIYTEVLQRYEDARLTLNRETPIFLVIDPVWYPNEKSAPSRFLIVLVFLLSGFVFSLLLILIQDLVSDFKTQRKNKNNV